MPRSFLKPFFETPRSSRLVLVDTRTGCTIASTLEIAGDSRSRRRGLLGRDVLAEQHALIITQCHAIHTFGMRFAIDVLFVARDGIVVKAQPQLPPSRICVSWGAHLVIELPAGSLQRSGIRCGDVLAIVPGTEGTPGPASEPSGRIQSSV